MRAMLKNATTMWSFPCGLVCATFVGLCLSARATSAATINFQEGASPTVGYTMAETDLRESSPGSNFAGARINVGSLSTSANDRMRNVLSFDIDGVGGVAPGDTVTSATLTFNVWGRANWDSNTDLLAVHSLTTNFSEGTATWNSPWGTAGGDYVATSLTAVTNTTGASFTIPSTPAFVAAANDAIADNNGVLNLILIAPNNEGLTVGSFIELYSAEFGTPSQHPLLTLTTVPPVPEPGTLGLLLVGAVLLRRRSARR